VWTMTRVCERARDTSGRQGAEAKAAGSKAGCVQVEHTNRNNCCRVELGTGSLIGHTAQQCVWRPKRYKGERHATRLAVCALTVLSVSERIDALGEWTC